MAKVLALLQHPQLADVVIGFAYAKTEELLELRLSSQALSGRVLEMAAGELHHSLAAVYRPADPNTPYTENSKTIVSKTSNFMLYAIARKLLGGLSNSAAVELGDCLREVLPFVDDAQRKCKSLMIVTDVVDRGSGRRLSPEDTAPLWLWPRGDPLQISPLLANLTEVVVSIPTAVPTHNVLSGSHNLKKFTLVASDEPLPWIGDSFLSRGGHLWSWCS